MSEGLVDTGGTFPRQAGLAYVRKLAELANGRKALGSTFP